METTLSIGTRVTLKDRYVDEAMTQPVTGTIEDITWSGGRAYVVRFDHDEDELFAPGGDDDDAWLERQRSKYANYHQTTDIPF